MTLSDVGEGCGGGWGVEPAEAAAGWLIIWIVWIKTIDGRPPRSERMTGLDQEQIDWLYAQLSCLVEWDAPTGRPRVLPLYTALVMVLFGLRQNMAPDVLAEVFGCGSTTVERYQDELEILIDMVLTPLYEQVRERARRDAVLVDGLVVPVGERDDSDGLFSDKKKYCGQNVQVVATLSGRLADVGDPCPGGMHDSGRSASPGSPRGGRPTINRAEWAWLVTKGIKGRGSALRTRSHPAGS